MPALQKARCWSSWKNCSKDSLCWHSILWPHHLCWQSIYSAAMIPLLHMVMDDPYHIIFPLPCVIVVRSSRLKMEEQIRSGQEGVYPKVAYWHRVLIFVWLFAGLTCRQQNMPSYRPFCQFDCHIKPIGGKIHSNALKQDASYINHEQKRDICQARCWITLII